MKKFLTSLSLIYATSAMSAGTILDRLGPIPCRTVDIVAGNCDKPGTGSSGTAPSLPAKPINTRHISISMDQHPHTHIATLSALIERDLVEHRLSPAELKNAKEHFVKLIDGINVPAAFLNSHSAMKKGLKADLENLSQGQFASALTGFAEVVKGFGQDKLVEGTSSLIEKVSPRTFEFLVNEQGYTRPEPDAVEFHGLNIDNFRNAIADFEAGNSFTSHSTGLMMGSTSRGKKDGKWTHEDRAYAAMIQGVKRGVQAAGVGLSAGGVVGSAVPGVGTVAVGLAGAVMGGTIGTIYGVMEGANNPELSGIPPSGIETKTSTKTEVGLTKSEADEKSGITTTTTPKKTTTTVTTKNLETGEENEVTTVVEKKEVMHDCSAGRVCVLSDIKKDGAGCDKPDDGYGDVAISKDAQEKAHKKFRERLRIMQDALILTLEPRFKSSDGMNKAYLEALRMSLVRPATPDEMNKPRGPLDGNFRPENPLLDPVRDRMRKIGL